MNRILEYLSILPSLSHHLFRIINFNDLSLFLLRIRERTRERSTGNERLNPKDPKDSDRQKIPFVLHLLIDPVVAFIQIFDI